MPERLTIRVGDLVVVHDPTPPYEPHQGRVIHAEHLPAGAKLCEVRLSNGKEVYPDPTRVHRTPLADSSECAWCSRKQDAE